VDCVQEESAICVDSWWLLKLLWGRGELEGTTAWKGHRRAFPTG